MRNKFGFTALCVVLALSSCEKVVLNELSDDEQSLGKSVLTVITRGEGDEEGETTPVAEGRVYVFNKSGKCVEMLSTDDDGQTATVYLTAGNYTLYAVGGDLARLNLPVKSAASPSSVISVAEGKVLDEVLLKKEEVTLKDGNELNKTITLERKVISLDLIEVKDVPTSVKKVEVVLSPLYGSVRLDGTYPDDPVESYKAELTKQADGKTWSVAPKKIVFPSKGLPTTRLTFTTDEGTDSYAYTASESLEANHAYSLSGTYQTSGVKMTGSLTVGSWGESRKMTFSFSSEQAAYSPVAGKMCNGYLVLSVDEEQRKATLLADQEVDYTVPTATDASAADDWQSAVTTAMSAHELPKNINGSWRLPTLAEVEQFSVDKRVVVWSTEDHSPAFFCTNDNNFGWGYTAFENESYVLKKSDVTKDKFAFKASIVLRPVIDITY